MAFADDLFSMGGREMDGKSVGFIGAGRITRILPGGFRRAGKLPSKVVVNDTNEDILQKLKNDFPEIDIAPNGNHLAARQDVVFAALHPPVAGNALPEIPQRILWQLWKLRFSAVGSFRETVFCYNKSRAPTANCLSMTTSIPKSPSRSAIVTPFRFVTASGFWKASSTCSELVFNSGRGVVEYVLPSIWSNLRFSGIDHSSDTGLCAKLQWFRWPQNNRL
jgi:hypothetical protein